MKHANIKYPSAKNSRSPIGINTNEIYEQDSSIPFVDLFRVSMPFHENIRCRAKDKPCLTSAEVEYDKQGWPKNLHGGKAGVFFLRNVQLAAIPDGDYTVLYDGEGKIEYLQNAKLISRKFGKDIIRFDARSDGFMTAALQITESNPSQPLRNIRILMPGGICQNNPFQHVTKPSSCKGKNATFLAFKDYYKEIIFNPDYLDFMKNFSVIRFMPMSGITRNPAQRWDQRPKMNKATWGGIYGSRGAPLEIQIALANKLKADPWLNVPHGADDDYMYRFAIYVKENLSPELTPHIEYTNEAWNVNFIHNEYMQKMGIAQRLDQDALMAGYKFYAKRSVEFFKIWETVYDGHEKLVRILGGWDTRPDISGIILGYKNTYKSVDALAIAPYVGGNLRGFRESETTDDIFNLLTDKKSYRSLPKIMHELKKHAKLAKDFGVSLIAYEGGQGLVDWAAKDYLQHPNPLFFSANRDSRMGDLYLNLYKQWREMGADLFVAFSAPRAFNSSGCWGLKEHIRQDIDAAPKLKASLAFINKNPRWWSWKKLKQKRKPSPSKISHYLPNPDPNKPRIVIRPAKGNKKHFYRLENPQALNILLEGKTWDKRDISGKWQVKWDKTYLYLSVKVYDKEAMSDSKDPRQDDSIEFFIDGNNSRGNQFDRNNDYHFIFARNKTKAVLGERNPRGFTINLPYKIEKKYDGYELQTKIKWSKLGIKPAIRNKLGMDVVINDDDDGGKRDARLGWNTRKSRPQPKDFGMILMSGR
ncbi:MAG TPA: hypothetical protein EYH20_00640 [Leucothrix sp.]|nr:hypothetical protein [Leucothrix sp.]